MIVIDKVFQGELAAQALSIVTLNMDVSIPSVDAALVVTGGSVIATGAAWTSVQLNGVPLVNLIQTSVAGADAEIWWLPNPPVGTYTLTISSGTGGEIYANAMIVLGLDRKSKNIVVASTTDAASASTISTLITPNSPNALVIDTLSTLDATAAPIKDVSQTQIFNANALAGSEYVISTYKIASTQQNINYNLSAAVNASLVVAVFRPARPASFWSPTITLRRTEDTITTNGLDANINPAFGQYGYKSENFYQNSFLHTVGRVLFNFIEKDIGILTSNLAGYWKFDEGTGDTVADSTNNNNGRWKNTVGTPANGNWRTNGIINSGGFFDGVSTATNYVLLKSGPMLSGRSKATLSLWVKTKILGVNLNSAVLYCEKGTAGNDNWRLDIAGDFSANSVGAVEFVYKDDAGTTNTTGSGTLQINDGLPHHIVVVKNGTTLQLYVDNNIVSTITLTATNNQTNATIETRIGADPTGVSVATQAIIDEVGVWTRDLTPFEVARLWNNGKGLSYPFVNNDFAVAIQGYNPYSRYQTSYWQTSFLQTIGRLRPLGDSNHFLTLLNAGT